METARCRPRTPADRRTCRIAIQIEVLLNVLGAATELDSSICCDNERSWICGELVVLIDCIDVLCFDEAVEGKRARTDLDALCDF